MLLAGGQGSRLGKLTRVLAKPAVSFGGKYRMIDCPLSNCSNSNIDTVGVLTQYRPLLLNAYIGNGSAWDLDSKDGGVYILPPYATESGGRWFEGTADAIYKNLDFIELYDPEYVLILSGDHLYRMDYRKMLESHKANQAEITVSVMEVAWEEASRFGIITAGEDDRIVKFTEKPPQPDSNLASMGIYIFNKDTLVKALMEDSEDPASDHDFGKNIIPKLLQEGKRLYCYSYSGYWRDVGTIDSYHQASMELLEENPQFDLYTTEFPMMSNANISPPQHIGPYGEVQNCLVGNGCQILGSARHSVLSIDSFIGPGALVEDSVILPGARVEAGAQVRRAILGENAVVQEGAVFGSAAPDSPIEVLGNREIFGKDGFEHG